MSNLEYRDILVRFRPENKEHDLYVSGARLIVQDGMYLIYGENGSTFMIPVSSVVYAACTSPDVKIQVVKKTSSAGSTTNCYDFRVTKDEEPE